MAGKVVVNTRSLGKIRMFRELAAALAFTGNRSQAIEALVLVGVKVFDAELYEQLRRHVNYSPELVAEMAVKTLRQVLPRLHAEAGACDGGVD